MKVFWVILSLVVFFYLGYAFLKICMANAADLTALYEKDILPGQEKQKKARKKRAKVHNNVTIPSRFVHSPEVN